MEIKENSEIAETKEQNAHKMFAFVESSSKTFKWKLLLSWDTFITVYKVVRTFESVDEILKCDHSNESY